MDVVAAAPELHTGYALLQLPMQQLDIDAWSESINLIVVIIMIFEMTK